MSAKIGFLFGQGRSRGKKRTMAKDNTEHAKCPFCKLPTALPCTQHNYVHCGMMAQAVVKALGPPRAPAFVDKHKDRDNCDCAACCEARAEKVQGSEKGTTWAPTPEWRERIARERAERKEAKKKRREEAAERNPQKAARLAASRGKPGSRKAKKHERRQRWHIKKSYSPSTLARPARAVVPVQPKIEVNVPRRLPNERELNEIVAMHTYRRPHKSESELEFIRRFIWPECAKAPVRGADEFGNLWAVIPHEDTKKPVRTMFSAHTDDVSYFPGRRAVAVNFGIMSVGAKDNSSCLGADDAAGCWMLLELMRAGTPGVYCFFRDEEHGGNGSRYFCKANAEHPQFMALDHSVAFDRFGYTSVITHQRGRRSCSDQFGEALATALGLDMRLDTTGVFTDTAMFTDNISECTNVSVGYKGQHGSGETQDLGFLCALRDAALAVNWDLLPAARDPKAVIIRPEPTQWWRRSGVANDQPEDHRPSEQARALKRAMGLLPIGRTTDREAEDFDEAIDDWNNKPRSMIDLVEDYPEHVADILEQCGYTIEGLHKEIMAALGQS